MQGAFVVQMGARGTEGREDVCGRVEEVDSGRSERFQSGEELLEFLRRRQRDAVTELAKEQ
jgi:hypothetical protein